LIRNADLRAELLRAQALDRVTPELGVMFMELVRNLSTKSNWRGYSYKDEMQSEALIQLCRGYQTYRVEKSENAFAWATAVSWNAFRKVLSREKKSQNTRDELIVAHGFSPSTGYLLSYEMSGWDETMVQPPSPGLVMKPGRGWGKAPGPAVVQKTPKAKPRGRPKKVQAT
jgi:hypothetical protein